MQTKRHLSVLGSIWRGLLYRHLVEGQLLGPFARDVFEMDRPLAEVLEQLDVAKVRLAGVLARR